MSTYGFRVHTLQPHVRRTQEYLRIEDVSAAGGAVDAAEQVFAELQVLQAAKTQLGSPTFFVDSEHEALKVQANSESNDLPYFEITKINRDGRVFEVVVETGREADHDALVSRDGTHESISQKAAVRRSTVILVFPKRGEVALMISEVRGRNYAGELLVQWLTRTAQRNAVSETDKGRQEEPWLNWKLAPQIDGNRLDNILANSSDHAFKLRRKTVNAQGTRGSYDIELVQLGLKQTPLEKVLDVLMKMSARKVSGTETERRKAAADDVLTLVEPDVSGVEFTDAELTFKENGKTQTVNSETIDQLFVYPLGAKRPKVDELRAKASPVVQRIAPGLGVQASLSIQA